jgi:glyoxylase-like metal-dependent hydrolase (beta-lactamase superfamily II)
MAHQEVVKGVYRVSPVPGVNTYLFDAEGLTLVDAGVASSAGPILAAIKELGHDPRDLKRIIVTHCHPDHYGSLAELKRATGARTIMHPTDAEEVRHGRRGRTMSFRGPLTILNGIFAGEPHLAPAEVEEEVEDGDRLPGGLRVVHTPGHSDGHLSLLWPEKRLLIAGDACWHLTRLAYMPFYVDFEEAKQSLAKLARLDFEVAAFGHGRPLRDAGAAFRRRWGATSS